MSYFGNYERIRAAYIAGWIERAEEPRPFKAARESMAERYVDQVRAADDAELGPYEDDTTSFTMVEPGYKISLPWTDVPLFSADEKTFVRDAINAMIAEKTKQHSRMSFALDRPEYVRAKDRRSAEIDRLAALEAGVDKKLETILFSYAGGDVQTKIGDPDVAPQNAGRHDDHTV